MTASRSVSTLGEPVISRAFSGILASAPSVLTAANAAGWVITGGKGVAACSAPGETSVLDSTNAAPTRDVGSEPSISATGAAAALCLTLGIAFQLAADVPNGEREPVGVAAELGGVERNRGPRAVAASLIVPRMRKRNSWFPVRLRPRLPPRAQQLLQRQQPLRMYQLQQAQLQVKSLLLPVVQIVKRPQHNLQIPRQFLFAEQDRRPRDTRPLIGEICSSSVCSPPIFAISVLRR